tara:strand:+ start:8450 stop:9838 length:1389 start_codon:yes stop_codon:yes gene_type:complete
MKYMNLTKNTIYLDDINIYLPFEDNVQTIDAETIKKSKSFQLLTEIGKIKIVEIDGSRIERNLKRKQKKFLERHNPIKIDHAQEYIESDKMQIRIKGHFEEAGGYAKVNRNLAFGLKKLGVDVCIEVLGSQNDLNELEVAQLNSLKRKPSRKSIFIDSIVPSFSNISTGKYNVLYTTVESHSVPKQFIESTNNYNEIWVVSEFCKDILKKSGVRQDIFVLPDSIDTKLYTDKGDKFKFRPALNDFVFLSVFGWSYRKGYDVLLKSYLKEFSGKDPVSLLLVSRLNNNTKQDKVIEKEVDNYIKLYGGDNPPHIVRCSKTIPEYLMPNVYRASDAFVLFSRGEGFSLTYCEASLCGLPIIGTNCSGQTMFLKKDNSYLLDVDCITKMEPGRMHVHYWDNQMFPALLSNDTIKQAGKLMRDVYEHGKKAKTRNKKLQKLVSNNYNIENISKRAYDRIVNIWSKL